MTVKSKTDSEKTRNYSDKIRQLYVLPETIEAAKAAKQAAKRAAKIAKAEERSLIAKTFRDNGVDIDIIVKSTGFTKEEILAL